MRSRRGTGQRRRVVPGGARIGAGSASRVLLRSGVRLSSVRSSVCRPFWLGLDRVPGGTVSLAVVGGRRAHIASIAATRTMTARAQAVMSRSKRERCAVVQATVSRRRVASFRSGPDQVAMGARTMRGTRCRPLATWLIADTTAVSGTRTLPVTGSNAAPATTSLAAARSAAIALQRGGRQRGRRDGRAPAA